MGRHVSTDGDWRGAALESAANLGTPAAEAGQAKSNTVTTTGFSWFSGFSGFGVLKVLKVL